MGSEGQQTMSGDIPETTISWKKIRYTIDLPKIGSVPLDCLPQPRIGVLHFPQVISRFDNIWDLIEMNLRKDYCLYSLHADGIVSVDLVFKMQLSNSLFAPEISAPYQWNCPTWWSITETGASWTVLRFNKQSLEILLKREFR